jgi:uncharacterized protein (TIGR03083 family)
MMEDWMSQIRSECTRLAGIIDGADFDLTVPSCPDWTIRDLIVHIGEVQRFWAGNLRAQDASSPWRAPPDRPASDADLVSWMRASTDLLLSALRDVGAASPCWTWWGQPLTSGAVGRHQVQEAAVHRWDAELTLGTRAPLNEAVALDGVAEFLEVMGAAGAISLAGSVTLVATDTGSEWLAGEGTASRAVVRAAASDLVLLHYRRLPLSSADTEGDTELAESLLGLAGRQA